MNLAAALTFEAQQRLPERVRGFASAFLRQRGEATPRCPACATPLLVQPGANPQDLPTINHPVPLCPEFVEMHEELV